MHLVSQTQINFNDTNRSEDCTSNQNGLAAQQAFTAITQVNDNISQWLRHHDFQPLNHQRDIRKIVFE